MPFIVLKETNRFSDSSAGSNSSKSRIVQLMVEGDFDVKLHPFLMGHVQPTAAIAEEGGVITRGCYDIVMKDGNNITWLMNGFEKFGYRFIAQSSFVLESSVKLCFTMHKEVEKGGRK